MAVQTVWAGGPEPTDWLTVIGTVDQIYPKDSTIVIIEEDGSSYTITGFPFGYLESEFDIVIKIDDCVTVDYAVVVCKTGAKNIAVALIPYCEDCGDACYEDKIVLRDEDFYPVDKSRNDDDSDHNHHHKHPDSDG